MKGLKGSKGSKQTKGLKGTKGSKGVEGANKVKTPVKDNTGRRGQTKKAPASVIATAKVVEEERVETNRKEMDDDDTITEVTETTRSSSGHEKLSELVFHERYGFLEKICFFCKKMKTHHYCHEKVPETNAKYIYKLNVICGKSFCHECKLKYKLETSKTCPDCFCEGLEEKELDELKTLCDDRDIKYGQKKKPGCIKLLRGAMKL